MSEPAPSPEPGLPSKPSVKLTERDSLLSAATVTSAVPPVPVIPALARSTESSSSPHRSLWIFLFFFLLCLLAARVFIPMLAERIQYAMTLGKERAQAAVATTRLNDRSLEELSKAWQMISKRVGPSVVHINVTGVANAAPKDEFAWLYRWETQGQGSGFIIDKEGYVVTNYHVVRGATEIRVSLSDGRTLDAKATGWDLPTDLALLRIRADNLIAADWGDSDELEVGALVWAMGSPFGLQRSITFGILSAKDRAGYAGSSVYQDFLQTDAAVNPGNSGGPLVDARGRVVGINTAIAGEAYQGISFAIPSSVARQIVERLKTTGHVERGWLGVSLADLSDATVRRLQLKDARGAHVIGVVTDSANPTPAQQAGIRPDDVVISWNGTPVKGATSLSLLIARTEVGSAGELRIIRRGQEMTLRLKVGRRPELLD